MPIIQKTAVVPYTPEQMFTLVNDVAHYPEFIPWCSGTQVISVAEDRMIARLDLMQSGFKQSFTTENILKKSESILMQLQHGPFQHFEGRWHFEPVENGCRVSLHMDFSFSSNLVGMLFGPVFEKAANKLVDCFCERARAIY